MKIYLHTYPVLYSVSDDERTNCPATEHGMLVIEYDNNGFIQVFLLNRSTKLRGLSPRGINTEEYDCNSWCIAYDKRRISAQPLIHTENGWTVRVEPLPPGCALANYIRGKFNMMPTKIIKEYI